MISSSYPASLGMWSGRRAEPAPYAFDVADPEALSDKGVQVDAAGDDVASSILIPESLAVGQGEFVEHFSLDQRQVVADAVPAAGG